MLESLDRVTFSSIVPTRGSVEVTYFSFMMRRWSYLMLLLTMLLNAFTTLALWTCSSTLAPPPPIFATVNGLANDFFLALPISVARLVREKQAVRGISIALTGWTAGFLTRGPTAGFLLGPTNADQQHSVVHYRPAISSRRWYRLLTAALVCLGWLRIGKSLPTGL